VSINVNGRDTKWVENETVIDLIKRMKYTFPLIVVKINNKVIPRKDFSEVVIPDKSKVDIIHMISGG
jgi:thiamine biosynthesis protein ThiS